MSKQITDIAALFNDRLYKPGTEPGDEVVIWRIDWNNIGSLGNFSVITGLPKAGKTRYLTAIIAAGIMRTEVFKQSVKLPVEKQHILHVDTEQSKYDYHRMIKQIKKYIQLDELSSFPEKFKSLSCRGMTAQKIMQIIEFYLSVTPECGIIVLDGLLDMIDRFNDEGEAKKVVQWVERMTEQYNILVIAVLHRTKSADKAIGHIGSAVERKAQSILIVEKNDQEGLITYNLKAEYLRNAEGFNPVSIYYNKGICDFELCDTMLIQPAGKEKFQNNRKKRAIDFDIQDHRLSCGQIFNATRELDYKNLIQRIQEVYGVGEGLAKSDYKPYLVRSGLIFDLGNGLYSNISQAKLFIAK
jgi:hypothetical protein